jgi:undecaprenyl-phosphate galactose phosphotransferase
VRNLKASIIIFLFDALALAAAFIVSGVIAHLISVTFFESNTPEFSIFGSRSRLYKFIFMSFAVLFAFYNRGHYTKRIPWWNQVRFVLIVLIVALVVDGFSFFAMKYQFSRIWTSLAWIIAFFFILFLRIITKTICEKMQIWSMPTIVIGSGDNAIDTIFAISSETYTGYDVKSLVLHNGYENFNRSSLPINCQNISIVDGSNDYSDYIKSHGGYFFMLAPDALSDIDIEGLIEKISDNGASYAMVPPVKGLSLYGNSPQYFFGHDIMLMQPRQKIDSPFSRIAKRGIDIFGSIFLLTILAPVFLFLTFLLRKEGGDAFFWNKRLGKNGKEFYCLKFRTMIPNAEQVLHEVLEKDPEAKALWETHRKLKNDPRITSVGNFLRKTSVDELPQLVNVLKGEMSLVGPRPILPDEVEFFNKWQMANYYSVRPGMTGLWQVSGRNDTSFKQRVHLDEWYVTNWSIWHDIVIIFKTFSVLVKRSGAY